MMAYVLCVHHQLKDFFYCQGWWEHTSWRYQRGNQIS